MQAQTLRRAANHGLQEILQILRTSCRTFASNLCWKKTTEVAMKSFVCFSGPVNANEQFARRFGQCLRW